MNHGFPAWEFSDEHFGLSPVVLLANLMAAVRLRANWPTWWRKQTSRNLPVRDNLLIFLAPQRKVLKWSLPSGVEMMWKRVRPRIQPKLTLCCVSRRILRTQWRNCQQFATRRPFALWMLARRFWRKLCVQRWYLNLVYDCRVMSGMGAKWDYYWFVL